MPELYVGTYSKGENGGIFRCSYENGKLTVLDTTDVENPSYLCYSPDKKMLYAASETRIFQDQHGGAAAALAVQEDGTLTLLNMIGTKGGAPCHVNTDAARKFLFVANYGEGTATVFSLDKNGALLDDPAIIVHSGKGPNPFRQEKPHVHMTLRTPDGKYCLVNDLGIDQVRFYPITEEGLSEKDVVINTVPGGEGPRHAVFGKDGKTLYLVTEMGNQVFAYAYDNGKLTEINHASTLPEDFSGRNTAAAVKISPDGKFVAASNRGDDSVAVFRICENGGILRVGIYSCDGQGPRDIEFTPDGSALLVANQNSENITVLSFNKESGALASTGESLSLPRPVCLLWR